MRTLAVAGLLMLTSAAVQAAIDDMTALVAAAKAQGH